MIIIIIIVNIIIIIANINIIIVVITIAIADEAKVNLQSHTGVGGTSSVLRCFVKVCLQKLASR